MTSIKKVPCMAATIAENTNQNTQEDYTIKLEKCKVQLLQKIVKQIKSHETRTGQKWPVTKPSGIPITCRYPNLAAEILARKCFLWYPADVMNITKERLVNVLESGEELGLNKAALICSHWNLTFNYLFSKTLFTMRDDQGNMITTAQFCQGHREDQERENTYVNL